jgi:uncharacterized protein YbjT (DUF2867 family)
VAVFPPAGVGAPNADLAGRQLVRFLLDSGEQVRVVVPVDGRHDWPAEAQVVPGELTSGRTLDAAFVDVDRAFFAGLSPETAAPVADRITKGELSRAVLLSSHGARHEAGLPAALRFHSVVEQTVENAGTPWTHLRSPGLMSGSRQWVQTIRESRPVCTPYGLAAYPYLHDSDLAAIAATMLLTTENQCAAHNLTGPAGITQIEQLRLISEAIGRPVEFQELSPEQARLRWRRQGWPESAIELQLRVLSELVNASTSINVENPSTVEQILARPARTYADWIAAHVHLFP